MPEPYFDSKMNGGLQNDSDRTKNISHRISSLTSLSANGLPLCTHGQCAYLAASLIMLFKCNTCSSISYISGIKQSTIDHGRPQISLVMGPRMCMSGRMFNFYGIFASSSTRPRRGLNSVQLRKTNRCALRSQVVIRIKNNLLFHNDNNRLNEWVRQI